MARSCRTPAASSSSLPRSSFPPVDSRVLGRLIAGTRAAIGSSLIAAPRLGSATWVGRPRRSAPTGVLTRAIGARDLAIGAGGLASRGDARRGWLAAGVLCDTVDLVATLIDRDELPDTAVPMVVATAGAGIALGLVALSGSQGDPPVPA
jgi:hypothetical protein